MCVGNNQTDVYTQIHTMPAIKKELAALPVTALHFYESFLLSGEGSYLVVYDHANNCNLSEKEVFSAATIHGIRTKNNHVAVFGGKSLRLLLIKSSISGQLSVFQEQSEEIKLPDWIWAIQWLCESQGCDGLPWQLAVALGHNAVALLNCTTGSIMEEIHCEDKCILYSAHFIGSQWRHLVLVAGTVFNHVVVWPVGRPGSNVTETMTKTGSHSPPSVAEVLHRLQGHKGVIFNITTHAERKLLCSVSDDRSIRLWKVNSVDTMQALSDWTVDIWVTATFDLIHVLFGHTARVWQAVMLDNGLVSVGEDSICIHWSYTGQIVKKIKGHKGRSIWSVACSKDDSLLATGGGDTSIRISSLSTHQEPGSMSRWNSQTLQPCEEQEDFPRIVRLLADSVLVMTNEGHLLCYDDIKARWKTLATDQRFQSYSVIQTSARTQSVVMGSIGGLVKFISLDGSISVECQLFDGKVLSLSCIEPDDDKEDLNVLANGPNGDLILLQLVQSHSTWHVLKKSRYYLPPSKQCWLTSACLLRKFSLLTCGDRGGTLHVYTVGVTKSLKETLHPTQSFHRVHSKAGLTDICYHYDYLYTCGRDGQYRRYQVTREGLHLLQASRVMKGVDWLTRFITCQDSLLILGFYMEQLMVYDLSQSELLASVACGGGHRAWDVGLCSDSYNSKFVYIKKKEVVLCDVILSSHCNVLKRALHGREINDVKSLFSKSGNLIATAGEDNLINIIQWNEVDSSKQEFKVVSRLQGHLSSVRTLAVSRSYKSSDDVNVVVLFSGGGRAQIMAWRIWYKEVTSNLKEDDFLLEQLANHVMIEDHGLRKSRTWKSDKYLADPETRIMSLDLFSLYELDNALPKSVHVVITGCSDAVLRVLLFNEQNATFHSIGQCSFHGHCILTVSHLITSSTSQRAIILSAGTDGRVAFWDITDLLYDILRLKSSVTGEGYSAADFCVKRDKAHREASEPDCHPDISDLGEPLWSHQCHQSGINSLDIKQISDLNYLLITGGDDNAICIQLLNMTSPEGDKVRINALRCWSKYDAHAAQVTGLAILSPTLILSVSIDQRAVLWKLNLVDLQLNQLHCTFLNVADISKLAVLRSSEHSKQKAVVCGVGLQAFCVDPAS